MTGHVVSFEPAGAPTRAVCSECGVLDIGRDQSLVDRAEEHAFWTAPDSRVEPAGLPPVERAS